MQLATLLLSAVIAGTHATPLGQITKPSSDFSLTKVSSDFAPTKVSSNLVLKARQEDQNRSVKARQEDQNRSVKARQEDQNRSVKARQEDQNRSVKARQEDQNRSVKARQETTNPHITDFRVFTTPDCSQEGNRGIFTVVNNDFTNSECKSLFSDYKAIVLGDINDGCTVTVYETKDCSDDGLELPLLQCSPAATTNYVSFSVNCAGHA